MKKKIVAIVLACIVIGVGIPGTIFGVKSYQKSKLIANVESVAMLNNGYFGGTMESDGMVTNDASQNVYVDGNQIIEKVLVEKGQEVKAGDPLIVYDMTSLELTIERKKLDIVSLEDKDTMLAKEIERLKKITPVEPVVEQPQEPIPEEQPQVVPLPELNKTGDVYNYISENCIPYNIETADGSIENPYCYLCDYEGFVTGSFLNTVLAESMNLGDKVPASSPVWVRIENRVGNTIDGDLEYSWLMSSATLAEATSDSRWSVAERREIPEEEPEVEAPVVEEPEPEEFVTTYTAEELAKAISDKEKERKSLDLQKRKAKLELAGLEEQAKDGTVYAKIDGVVKELQDLDNLSNDGSPFLTVSGSEGLYVKGSVSELMLEQIQIGQQVMAFSWQSGMNFTAEITSIDPYPNANGGYYGGNPNCSYYDYIAYIEDPTGLTNGEYLSLSIETADADSNNTIFLDKSYVREEDGKYYVMKAENGVLKKQYITTGRILNSGYTIEIKSGITFDDYIAFPYGKNAQEGVKVNMEQEMPYEEDGDISPEDFIDDYGTEAVLDEWSETEMME